MASLFRLQCCKDPKFFTCVPSRGNPFHSPHQYSRSVSVSPKTVDLYEILKVAKGASGEDIKQAFYKLSKQYHPDVNNTPKAQETFQRVSQAYLTLSNKKTKRLYDIKIQNTLAMPDEGFFSLIDVPKIETVAGDAHFRKSDINFNQSINAQAEYKRKQMRVIKLTGATGATSMTYHFREPAVNRVALNNLRTVAYTLIMVIFGCSVYYILCEPMKKGAKT